MSIWVVFNGGDIGRDILDFVELRKGDNYYGKRNGMVSV